MSINSPSDGATEHRHPDRRARVKARLPDPTAQAGGGGHSGDGSRRKRIRRNITPSEGFIGRPVADPYDRDWCYARQRGGRQRGHTRAGAKAAGQAAPTIGVVVMVVRRIVVMMFVGTRHFRVPVRTKRRSSERSGATAHECERAQDQQSLA